MISPINYECISCGFLDFLVCSCELTDHKKQESREEFSDWPNGLLAIGTFGNNNNNEQIKSNPHCQEQEQEKDDNNEVTDFTPEEIGNLHRELNKLLRQEPNNAEKEIADLPLDKFLNCPSSLVVDRRISNSMCGDSDDKDDEDVEKRLRIILGKCKDVCGDNGKKAIGKKPISYILKKLFVCRSGIVTPPNPKDILQESKLEKVCIALFGLNYFMIAKMDLTDLVDLF